MTRQKRGISDLIATVLMILIVIAAVSMIWQFVMPMLKPSAKLLECPKYPLSVNLNEGATYWDDTVSGTMNEVYVMVSAGSDVVKANLKNIQIKIKHGTKSETFYLNANGTTSTARVTEGTTTSIPGPNEDVTYQFTLTDAIVTGETVFASIAPIITPSTGEKAALCDMTNPVQVAPLSEFA